MHNWFHAPWYSRQPNFTDPALPRHYSWRFWAAATGAGVLAGLGAGLLMHLLRLVQHLAWHYQAGSFLAAVEQAAPSRRLLVMAGAGVLAALALGAARRWWPKPGWGLSSGIWLHEGSLPLWASLYNGVLAVVLVGLGTALGRESAPKEAGAAFAARLAALAGLSVPERQLLAACGAGAGMAAVYNVPFGGALFALEVLLGTLALPAVLPALLVALLATWVSWFFLPQSPTFAVEATAVTGPLLLWSLGFGVLAGAASAAYVRLMGRARRAAGSGGASTYWLPLLVLPALGLVAGWFPQVLGNGRNVVQLAFDHRLPLGLLATLLVLRPLASAACLRAGTPGGLFTPTLTVGALLGGLAAYGWAALWPSAVPATALGAYAAVGAGALLAASTQAPLSAIVLVLELGTHADRLLMPLLLAATVAAYVARRLEARSIYAYAIPAANPEVAAPTPPAEPAPADWHTAITA